MGLIVFLLVSALAVVVFIIGFPLLKGGSDQAAAEIPNYTANASAWTGLSGSFSLVPLAAGMILVGFIVFGIWQHVRKKAR
jgi:hypothetical protein